MPVISNQYTIDAQQAVQTMQSLQQEFIKYNSAVGAMSAQTAAFNTKAQNSVQTFTQIDSAGRKVTSTIRETATGYELLGVKVGAATAKQREYAAELERQKTLAESFARTIRGGSSGQGTTTAFPGALTPAQLGQSVAGLTQLSQAQLQAAATSQQLNAAQSATLLGLPQKIAAGATAFGVLNTAVQNTRNSFQEFGKIAFATAIYRGISLIQQGLSASIKDATEYSTQIALIQTIADKNAAGFDTWSKAIRGVADQFGRPVGEIATAAYDALSNQVIKTSEDFTEFGSVAARLARITGGTTADAVNVLSSVINSYGLASSDASKITDELFRTVDLGRVRLNELNSVYARTISLGRQSGSSFQEINAGLVVLTQQGLNSAESATLLNNVFSQLIKPNEALAGQFKAMGFASGEAAVKTLGFAGVMKVLRDASVGAKNGLAQFFPELRGLRGFGAISEDIDKFVKVLDELKNSSGAGITADNIFSANEGVKLQTEFERIKTFFTVDLGTKGLNGLVSVTEAFGGLSNIIKGVTEAAILLGTSATGVFAVTKIVTYSGAIIDLGVNFLSLRSTVGSLGAAQAIFGKAIASSAISALALQAAFVAIPAAIALGIILFERYQAEITKANAAATAKIAKEEQEANKKAAEARVAAFEKSSNEMSQSFGRFIARAKVKNNELRDALEESGKAIQESLKNSSQIFETIINHGLDSFKNRISEIKKNLQELATTQEDSRKTLADKQFSGREAQLNEALSKRAPVLQKRGINQDTEGLKAYRNLISNRANEVNQELNQNFNLGNFKEAKQNYTEIIDLLEKLRQKGFQVDALEAKFTKNFNDRAAAAAQKQQLLLEETNRRFVQYQEQFKQLQDTLSTVFKLPGTAFNKDGDLIPKYRNNVKSLFTDLEKAQNEALKLAQDLSKVGNDPAALLQYQAELINIQSKFAEQRRDLEKKVGTEQRDKNLDKSQLATAANIEAESKAIKKFSADLEANQKILSKSKKDVLDLFQEINKTIDGPFGSASTLNALGHQDQNFSTAGAARLKQLEAEAQQHLATLDKDPGNVEARRGLLSAGNEVQGIVKQSAPDKKIVDPKDTEQLITFTQAAERLRNTIGSLSSISGDTKEIAENFDKAKIAADASNAALTAFIAKADPGLAALIASEKTLIDNAAPLSDSAKAFDDIAVAANRATAAVNQLIAAEQAAAAAAPGGGGGGGGAAENFASGGRVGSQGGFLENFFAGKFARGTDRIPTMLSKNEYVVRAPMAEKYYSQLVAINSGHAPLYRASGGPVSHNSTRVGDIHLNIQGGAGMNAPELVRQIRRGIQNNTLKI